MSFWALTALSTCCAAIQAVTTPPVMVPLPTNFVGSGWETWSFLTAYGKGALDNAAFAAAVRAWSGGAGTLRVGGITADWTVYDLRPAPSATGDVAHNSHRAPPPPPPPPPSSLPCSCGK